MIYERGCLENFLKLLIRLKVKITSRQMNYKVKGMSWVREREEKEKENVIALLQKQLSVEDELVQLYEETAAVIKSRPVRHLLHMIQLDSRKHIDICQMVIEILQGEEMLSDKKEELIEGLQRHIELEQGSIDRANEMLKNVWIKETQGLKELIEKLRNDEKRHHKALKKLAEKAFFRLDPNEMVAIFRNMEWLEERYKRKRRFEKME